MFHKIGPHVFSSKERIREHASRILRRQTPEQPIEGVEREFLMALLLSHSRATRKIGPGVATLFVRTHSVWGGKDDRCFWLRRTDGSETDWSFRECIWPTDHRSEFIRACRTAIVPQIVAFRKRMREQLGETAVCPISGQEFQVMEANVDHQHPNTFEAIVDQFIDEHSIDISSTEIASGNDGQLQDRFSDPMIERSWIVFHADRAVLRMLPAKVNANLGNRQRIS